MSEESIEILVRDLEALRDHTERHPADGRCCPWTRQEAWNAAMDKAIESVRLRSEPQSLRAALQKIADHYERCGCTHDTEDCCEKVGEFCPHCISEIALSGSYDSRTERTTEEQTPGVDPLEGK